MTDSLSFLSSQNADFISELYIRYNDDPGSVDASWQDFFDELGDEGREILAEMSGASWVKRSGGVIGQRSEAQAAKINGATAHSGDVRQSVMDSIRALMLIRAYRVRGHLYAQLDPLGLETPEYHAELDPAHYGFTDTDYDRPIFINHVLGMESATLHEIMNVLKRTYCGTIGVEFTHIQDPEQKSWIQKRIEGGLNHTDFTVNGKKAILDKLTVAEGFEQFLHTKYPGTKRFGLDGGEALIPALEQVIKRGGQLGLQQIAFGMAHRGRLNVLANVMDKPYTAIFSEFLGTSAHPESFEGSGDVKYHLGASSDREFDGNKVHLSLTANPSHLEAVNPVVLGKVRAKQQLIAKGEVTDEARRAVMGVLLHGDAAFAGQGPVAETLALSDLRGYRTGGTLHVIINNQIGFTTNPNDSRSGPYPTDVAQMLQAPIFHVNGDDVEAVVHVSRIATEFRQKFMKDVVVDIFCYRRYGHNEGDEPLFTQPLMYQKIAGQDTTRKIYAHKLETQKIITPGEGQQLVKDFHAQLDQDFEAAKNYKPNKADWLEGAWSGLEQASGDDRRGDTAVLQKRLKEIGRSILTVPEAFNAHSKLVRQFKTKLDAIEKGQAIDWALAEALAFGTLLDQGYAVRLSGQDCGRGTFSQRHSVWSDQKDGHRYVPLNHLSDDQPTFYEVLDSPLSEAAVLGFEYGFSLADPNSLVMWEAQFGDFANGAQVIIDQFISSGEAKWMRMSGLVMLLPHGYEGQGPEHSSARLERFLQMCGQDNWQVANCTTPANYFHLLRRQMNRKFRKPLVVMTPKSLLRHKECVSPLSMFTGDQTFHRVLYEDQLPGPAAKMKRVVLCSGKVYYDLKAERDKRGIKDVTMLRLEQLYPFPAKALATELAQFPNAEVVWCQEEPENMGAWTYVDRRIEAVLDTIKTKSKRPRYVGRDIAASPATGLMKRHIAEQQALVDEALTIR